MIPFSSFCLTFFSSEENMSAGQKRKGSPSDSENVKKMSKMTKMLTYGVKGKTVQISDDKTYFDLIEAICGKVCVGDKEGVYDHMWKVMDCYEGTVYEGLLFF